MKTQKIKLKKLRGVNMYVSSGLVIIKNNKILLCHPTNRKWYGTYTFPKGKVERGETLLEAAIRETKEEVGLKIDPKNIKTEPKVISYLDKNGKKYKEVYYFVYEPKEDIIINHKKLQLEEIDWAGFIDKEESQYRLFWRFTEILDLLK